MGCVNQVGWRKKGIIYNGVFNPINQDVWGGSQDVPLAGMPGNANWVFKPIYSISGSVFESPTNYTMKNGNDFVTTLTATFDVSGADCQKLITLKAQSSSNQY